MTECYECKNWNHPDCTVRLGRRNAECDCWCLGSEKYMIQMPSIKTSVRKHGI